MHISNVPYYRFTFSQLWGIPLQLRNPLNISMMNRPEAEVYKETGIYVWKLHSAIRYLIAKRHGQK